MENREETYEMEEMRQQIALLKHKLDRQVIVNDEVLKRAMNRHLDNINRRMWTLNVVGILTVFLGPYVFHEIIGTSMAFTIFAAISLFLCVAANIWMMNLLPKSEDMNSDILSVDMKLARFSKFKSIRTIIGIGLVSALMLWLMFDIPENEAHDMFVISIFIGFAIGLIIGINQYRLLIKHVREIRENAAQIKRLRKEGQDR